MSNQPTADFIVSLDAPNAIVLHMVKNMVDMKPCNVQFISKGQTLLTMLVKGGEVIHCINPDEGFFRCQGQPLVDLPDLMRHLTLHGYIRSPMEGRYFWCGHELATW